MLRILTKTASSMAKIGRSTPDARREDVDLSAWELVSPSHSDDEDLYSFDGDDVTSGGYDGDARSTSVLLTPCDIVSVQCLSISPPLTLPVETTAFDGHACHGDGDVHDDVARDVDDDDDDGDCDYDDELVPWKLKGRFGKQRLRKLGKRGGPNPNKSKRMPFYYNRPGCLYGKHGFGVQHSFV